MRPQQVRAYGWSRKSLGEVNPVPADLSWLQAAPGNACSSSCALGSPATP